MKLFKNNFLIRLKSWEYWPFGIVQFPLFIYWLWLSLKARSLLFFTASNPGIFMGGMFGESKFDVIKKIPAQFIAKSFLVRLPSSLSDVLNIINQENFTYPLIFKPDIGERGFMVKRINSEQDVLSYLENIKSDFIIQEFLDLPFECGIFYTRFPERDAGEVTSIVTKEMLFVEGDGTSTLKELILNKERSRLQWETLKETFEHKLNDVITSGEKFVLNEIGNHCLGTKFLNGEGLMNKDLSNLFDELSKKIDGFYFGRYDLRSSSIEDLYRGNFKIMELNGCGAEPAHIYEPGFSLWKALGVQFTHWKNLYTISKQNHKRGVNYVSLREGIRAYKKFKRAMK